ncbi:MAG: hypothetical protein M5U26_00860 [Planctomycetota bacterium]|nr:hypothetical protein [Planctomycetota bacterium]
MHGRLALGMLLLMLACGATRAGEPAAQIEADKPLGGWTFMNGPEFPGATGALELVPEAEGLGRPALKLSGDFTKGGNYVQAAKEFEKGLVARLAFRVKAPGAKQLTIRVVDGSKQCHQINLKLDAGDGWQALDFPLLDFFKHMGAPAAVQGVAKYEKWGGANDGKWHAPARSLAILAGRHTKPESLQPTVWIADVALHPPEGASYEEDFEAADALPAGWSAKGQAAAASGTAYRGKRALKLERNLENLQAETGATGATFPARPGVWEGSGAVRTELNSPDNSYRVEVAVEALKADGSALESVTLLEEFGKKDWRVPKKKFELPPGTAQARIVVRLHKADGACWIDDLSLARVGGDEKRIDRIVLSTARLGNLLFPDDKRLAHVRVEALRELRDEERKLRASVRDYWGAAQATPLETELKPEGKDKDRFAYTAEVDLSGMPLETGRFYELHAELPGAAGDPDTEFTGFAILPEAPARGFKPEEIPFTIRNWDNRLKDYFFLADRLGIRNLGIWGGWASKKPYAPHAPGVEFCKELGARWITTTPAASVEREGFAEYDEAALREGMTNFLKAYAGPSLGAIAQGNEPHGKLEKVKENVRAYKAVYESVKAFDPKILVIGTSVEPNADYFNEGYYKYLDAYDYHVYEGYRNVRKAFQEYKALMQKFDAVKPVYSTELGLNSQGMSRYTVALELVKSTTAFFAEGGVSVSWFTIMYPDPKGKSRGSSGEAHCVFDCKYSQYNPKLDAITYYAVVNALLDKKFAEEKQYEDGTQAFLFRNGAGQCLQVLWNERGRKDVAVPLPGVKAAEILRIDGTRTACALADGVLPASVSNEPILLLYEQQAAKLAEALKPSEFKLLEAPEVFVKGKSATLEIKVPRGLKLIGPPLWKYSEYTFEVGVASCQIAVPADATAREARILARMLDVKGNVLGEIAVLAPVRSQ